MKKGVCFILAFWGLARFEVLSQQNFFNVPSSDITEKGCFFFQQQLNLFSENLVSNSTLCYGLGRKYEIGLNALGFTYDYQKEEFVRSGGLRRQPVYPSVGLNFQKELFTRTNYALSIGSQVMFPSKIDETEYYIYLNNKVSWNRFKFISGIYAENNNYFGLETRFSKALKKAGVQAGLEYQLVKDKLFFQADFISGRTSMSNVIVGGAFRFAEKWILSAGYQVPNSRYSSTNGLILELTFVQ